jgi:glycosyltransferase involved in cell wall biosynthesis
MSRPEILLIYPHPHLKIFQSTERSGSALRMTLLVKFLSENGYNTKLVFPSRIYDSFMLEGASFETLVFPSNIFFKGLFFLIRRVNRVFRSQLWDDIFEQYLFPWMDLGFRARLKKVINKCDIAILEMSFWFFVPGMIKRLGKPAVFTAHNLEWEIRTAFRYKPIREIMGKILKSLELWNMRTSDAVIGVNPDEVKYLRECGIEPVFEIRNCVEPKELTPGSVDERIKAIWGVTEKSAMFIGSGYVPNRLAADIIRTKIAPAALDYVFYVLGNVTGEIRNRDDYPQNVVFVGPVPIEELHAFYRQVGFVIIPLIQGGGISLKTLEAMSFRKVIITSSVGMRGIEFEDGVHGIISDDFEKYGEIFRKLSLNPHTMNTLKENAFKLSEKYNYSEVYKGYFEVVDYILKNKN